MRGIRTHDLSHCNLKSYSLDFNHSESMLNSFSSYFENRVDVCPPHVQDIFWFHFKHLIYFILVAALLSVCLLLVIIPSFTALCLSGSDAPSREIPESTQTSPASGSGSNQLLNKYPSSTSLIVSVLYNKFICLKLMHSI